MSRPLLTRSSLQTSIFRGWPAHILALVAYWVGSLLATWPLAAHLTTHAPGDGIDDPALAWNLWWIKARLVDQLQPDIFHVGWMFHPIEINLGFYTLTPLNGLISVPIQSATTLVVANNILLLLSFVLGGYGTWLLAQNVWAHHVRKLEPRLAWAISWLAGAFYAFAGAKLFYASLGQFNIASSYWIPFCALYLWRTTQSHNTRDAWRNGLFAGLFLVFQAWAELTYATFLLILFALVYLHFSIAWLLSKPQAENRTRWWHTTQAMIAAALVFAIGLAPFLAAMLPDMRVEGDFFGSGGGFADQYSADLMGYLIPTRLHPWLGDWVSTLPFSNDKAQHIYLGYSLLILLTMGSVAGLRQAKERKITLFWLIAFITFWLLTLGPHWRWAGNDLPIPGPFALVSQLPFFNGNRYPSRYSVMLLLTAALLATRGLIWCIRRLDTTQPRHALVALTLIGTLFAMEHLSVPLPISDFRVPAIYQRLVQEAGDFTLLELPTGWRNGARVLGKSDILIMRQQWYQTTHGKRRLGGNTSRNPAYKFQYFTETPIIGNLIALMNADRPHLTDYLHEQYPTLVEEARRSAPAFFDLLGIRYVTLHVERSPQLLVQFVEDALPVTFVEEWQGVDWDGAPSTIRLYTVNETTPTDSLSIDLASAEAQMYLAEGWSPVAAPQIGRYASRQSVDLLLPAPHQATQLTLTYSQPTRVTYALDGRALGEQSGTIHALTLPATNSTAPTSRLTLTFLDAPKHIADLVPMATPVGNTGSSLAPGVAIVAQSAGEETGNFAHIWVNGVDYADSQRGYNLVALNGTGEVLDSQTFDTFTAEESARMATWIERWEAGTIIVGAGADTVEHLNGEMLGENVITALQKIGVAGDLRGKFRWSHAFIGVVGAPTASAIEEIQLIQPATVWIGAPLSNPSGYGPLQNITLSTK